ncbi:MAG: DUF1549 domain-containing protein [Byssovorax sp.]
MRHLAHPFIGALFVAAIATAGCKKNDPGELLGAGTSNGECPSGAGGMSATTAAATTGGVGGAMSTAASTSAATGTGGAGGALTGTVLDQRKKSYTEALRTASFKLVGNAPTLQQIEDLKSSSDPQKDYEADIDAMMADVRFAKRMIAFWQNTMRLGGSAGGGKPTRDTAPTFAARLTVEGTNLGNLFTATSNTCPTFDGTVFVDGDCTNGPITAGILADPGLQSQYYGNLAFRRVRFFQETFACRKQPAELSAMPTPIGTNGQSYTSPWDFKSIAGTDNGGRIDFHDVSSAICANCHTSSNHRAPLFANFDDSGKYQPTIQVQVPVAMLPAAVIDDWLPQTNTPSGMPEGPAWKYLVPTKDLTELGAAMAADDEVMTCAVSRVWNYAMSKGDIVNDAATVAPEVIAPLYKNFKQNGYNLRSVIRAAFVHEDFVRF